MTNTELDVEQIFKSFRETVGNQAQDIAVLKATIVALEETISEMQKASIATTTTKSPSVSSE